MLDVSAAAKSTLENSDGDKRSSVAQIDVTWLESEPEICQTNLSFDIQRPGRNTQDPPRGGHGHSRGAPLHLNNQGYHTFIPTGPNSIQSSTGWGGHDTSTAKTIAPPTGPSTPMPTSPASTDASVPSSNLSTPSSPSTPWIPTPSNVWTAARTNDLTTSMAAKPQQLTYCPTLLTKWPNCLWMGHHSTPGASHQFYEKYYLLPLLSYHSPVHSPLIPRVQITSSNASVQVPWHWLMATDTFPLTWHCHYPTPRHLQSLHNIQYIQWLCSHEDSGHVISFLVREAAHLRPMADDHMIWLGNFNRHHPLWDEDHNTHLFTNH